jgi:hypothetical protein
MTSPDPADVKRVEHARRVLSEASNGLLTADWGTLYWIAEQVPQLLDVIDHLLPEAAARIPDNGDPAATVPDGVVGYRPCQRCRTEPAVNGPWCKGSCEQLDRGNEETWWRKAVQP